MVKYLKPLFLLSKRLNVQKGQQWLFTNHPILKWFLRKLTRKHSLFQILLLIIIVSKNLQNRFKKNLWWIEKFPRFKISFLAPEVSQQRRRRVQNLQKAQRVKAHKLQICQLPKHLLADWKDEPEL